MHLPIRECFGLSLQSHLGQAGMDTWLVVRYSGLCFCLHGITRYVVAQLFTYTIILQKSTHPLLQTCKVLRLWALFSKTAVSIWLLGVSEHWLLTPYKLPRSGLSVCWNLWHLISYICFTRWSLKWLFPLLAWALMWIVRSTEILTVIKFSSFAQKITHMCPS